MTETDYTVLHCPVVQNKPWMLDPLPPDVANQFTPNYNNNNNKYMNENALMPYDQRFKSKILCSGGLSTFIVILPDCITKNYTNIQLL